MAYALRQALGSLAGARKIHAASLIAVAVVLLLVGLTLSTESEVGALTRSIGSRSVVTAYLNPSASTGTVAADETRLSRDSGVVAVHYVDAAGALAQMRISLGSQAGILGELGGVNPFTGYLAIQVDPRDAGTVATQAKSLQAVTLVQDNQSVVNRLLSLQHASRLATAAMLGIAVILALVVVSHVIRLSFLARRDEVDTMRWMGASPGFIALPFLMEGLVIGVLGGIVASGLLALCLPMGSVVIGKSLPFLPLAGWTGLWTAAAGAALGLGILCGALGSWIAVRQS